jgi:cobalt-zinc-cadmium efflux system protein
MATLIVREAYGRFVSPVEINTIQLLTVASLGLAANLVMVGLLQKGHHESLTVKSAWLHVIGDSLASVGVIVSGLVLMLTGWRYVDPIVSIMIALLIFFGGWRLVRDAARILLEFAPRSLRAVDLEAGILAVDGVKEVHDLHLWAITPQFPYLSAHLLVDEQSLSQAHGIMKKVEETLRRMGVSHTTLQVECIGCGSESTFCAQEQVGGRPAR